MIRWCADIGMFAFDLPIKKTCRFRTAFCNATCYNNKFYKIYKNSMKTCDDKLWEFWNSTSAEEFVAILKRKRKSIARFRFCTRGEIFYDKASVDKVAKIMELLPDTEFWIPTRAWRKDAMREYVEQTILPLANARVMASLDPSNTIMEIAKIPNWTKMFFGDDDAEHMGIHCPKTWDKANGHCATCTVGCFNYNDVHLKKH